LQRKKFSTVDVKPVKANHKHHRGTRGTKSDNARFEKVVRKLGFRPDISEVENTHSIRQQSVLKQRRKEELVHDKRYVTFGVKERDPEVSKLKISKRRAEYFETKTVDPEFKGIGDSGKGKAMANRKLPWSKDKTKGSRLEHATSTTKVSDQKRSATDLAHDIILGVKVDISDKEFRQKVRSELSANKKQMDLEAIEAARLVLKANKHKTSKRLFCIPSLLLILILLFIGGIELNPGPETNIPLLPVIKTTCKSWATIINGSKCTKVKGTHTKMMCPECDCRLEMTGPHSFVHVFKLYKDEILPRDWEQSSSRTIFQYGKCIGLPSIQFDDDIGDGNYRIVKGVADLLLVPVASDWKTIQQHHERLTPPISQIGIFAKLNISRKKNVEEVPLLTKETSVDTIGEETPKTNVADKPPTNPPGEVKQMVDGEPLQLKTPEGKQDIDVCISIDEQIPLIDNREKPQPGDADYEQYMREKNMPPSPCSTTTDTFTPSKSVVLEIQQGNQIPEKTGQTLNTQQGNVEVLEIKQGQQIPEKTGEQTPTDEGQSVSTAQPLPPPNNNGTTGTGGRALNIVRPPPPPPPPTPDQLPELLGHDCTMKDSLYVFCFLRQLPYWYVKIMHWIGLIKVHRSIGTMPYVEEKRLANTRNIVETKQHMQYSRLDFEFKHTVPVWLLIICCCIS